MPWIALLCLGLVGACSFDADYTSGTYSCSDNKCPSGLVCQANMCVAERRDAAVDVVDTMPGDATDAQMPELSCAVPGMLSTTGGMASGTTTGHMNNLFPQCNGFVMNGLDAVYSISPMPGKQMTVTIATASGSYMVAAYVTSPCMATACVSTQYATPGNSKTYTTVAGTQYIIVDSTIAGQSGPFTLTVTVN